MAQKYKLIQTPKESDKYVAFPHHFGKVELRVLLDYLYGGEPKEPSEQLD